MRPTCCLASLASTVLAGFFLVALVFMTPDYAVAGDKPADTSTTGPCSSPEQPKAAPENPWVRPKLAELKPLAPSALDESDEVAALDAIRTALVEVADGSSYVWHRHHGRLSGVVQPTQSFKDAAGNVCRHILTILSAGARSKTLEAVACRLPDGNWQLDG